MLRIFGLSAFAAAIVASFALSVPSGAVAQVIVGGQVKPAVVIDNSVLERLGPEPMLSDLFLNRPPAQMNGADAPAKATVLKRPKSSKLTVTLRNPNRTAKPIAKDTKLANATAAAKPTAVTAPAPAKATETEVKTAEAPVELKPEQKPVETAKPAEPEAAKEAPKAPEAVKTVEASPPPPPAAPQPVATQPPPPPPVAIAAPAPAPSPAAAPQETQSAAPQAPVAQPPAQAASAAPPPRPVTPTPPPPAPSLSLGAPPPLPPIGVPAPPAQEARLTPPAPAPHNAAPLADGQQTIGFDPDGAALSTDARSLLTSLAQKLNSDGDLTVMLMAYAAGTDDTASRSRHLSLSRALAIRSFLIDQGVRSTRIEVRALGNKVPDGPADRVDMIVQKR